MTITGWYTSNDKLWDISHSNVVTLTYRDTMYVILEVVGNVSC